VSLTNKAKRLEQNPKQPLLERLNDEQLAELIELRKNYRKGELKNVSMRSLAELIKKEFGWKTLNAQTIERFLLDESDQ
jgi:hypothetical protein